MLPGTHFFDGPQLSYRVFLYIFYDMENTSFQISFKFGKQITVGVAQSGEQVGCGTVDV
jgi:hypothetical protein